MKTTHKLYIRYPSGLIVQSGIVTSIDKQDKSSFLEIKKKGEKIEELFSESIVKLNPNCGLKKLINDSNILWSSWLAYNEKEINFKLLFNALVLNRIANSILLLSDLPINERKQQLEKLKKGSLEFIKRTRSVAKDKIWELEFWSQLKGKMQNVFLDENPDVVIKWMDAKIGIACKKLYSERHVQNVLSNAVKQIESTFEFGIVAMNIDDIVPSNCILQVDNPKQARNFIQNINTEFINRHDRHFRKYLENERIISIIVSTSMIIDSQIGSPRFSYVTEWTVWTLPEISPSKQTQVERLFRLIMSQQPR